MGTFLLPSAPIDTLSAPLVLHTPYSTSCTWLRQAPQLIGFNIKGAVKGTIAVDITLNLSELAFVGVGQLVCADPLTGRIIISGHDSTVMGHHIFWVDPFGADPSKATTIAKIAAPAVYLLGGSCAVDWDAKVSS